MPRFVYSSSSPLDLLSLRKRWINSSAAMKISWMRWRRRRHRHSRASQDLLLVLDEWDRECHPAWRKVCCWDLYCKILMLQMHPLTHSISLEEGLCHCCWEVLMDACVSWYWSLDSHTANYLLLVCIRVAREDWTLNRGVSADSHVSRASEGLWCGRLSRFGWVVLLL